MDARTCESCGTLAELAHLHLAACTAGHVISVHQQGIGAPGASWRVASSCVKDGIVCAMLLVYLQSHPS